MYVIEVFDKGKWERLERTRTASKTALEQEVDELNKTLPKEVTRLLPVSKKYRVIKVKGKV